MQRGNSTTDYAKFAKQGFLLGVGAFLVGELTEPIQHSFGMVVPGWEHSLLFLLTVLGVLTALLAPFVFGVALPLTQ
ncbi:MULTISPECIES: hypothetical protein [Haloglomus]|jgi:hypothetical protein|uniref:DUF7860 family protein n=1 Tax=Haloglomus TaxID=2806252 RepID=UPI0020C98A74|nr:MULTISPECIES: hypothetical protein [Haloglomus]